MSDVKAESEESTKQLDLTQIPTNALGQVATVDLDDAILRAQGHASELERSFSRLGAIGLAYSICNSWLTYASCFGAALNWGGGVTAVFGLILACAVQWITLLGLSELISAFPSSGGQYHFTYIIAPQRTRRFAAFVTGTIDILAWWIGTSSGTLYTAISAFGTAAVWYPDFAQHQWQVYLCYLATIILTLVPIMTVPQRKIDYMTQAAMYLSIIGIVLVILVCLIMGRGNYESGGILVDWQGRSGWNQGTSWLLSIGVGMYCFAGAGAVTHIAEEIPAPSKRLPETINMTMILGITVALPFILVMCVSIHDLEAVQTSFLPSLEVFYQATGSKVAATALQAYLTLLYFTCVPSQWITSSRIVWAFSRDNGVPFSTYWQHIDKKRGIPVRTTLLSAGFCAIYGLLYVASTAAYNSIINTAVLLLNVTYTIPQGILITSGRDKLPARHFKLGKFGYAVNGFSVIWLIVSGVVFCLPTTIPTATASMNYNSVVLVGLFVLVSLVWIERRNKFTGPKIDWDALNAGNRKMSIHQHQVQDIRRESRRFSVQSDNRGAHEE